MKRRFFSSLALGTVLFYGGATFVRADELPEAIASADAAFAIPLQIEADPEIAEVRLYASSDQGKTWRVEKRVMPPVAGFDFHGQGDGEYWFLVRTLDRRGQESPAGAMVPELRVVVDSKPPQLILNAQRAADGRITADWRAVDRHVVAESLKLSYRAAADGPWLPIQTTRTKRSGDATQSSGQFEWSPPTGAADVTLRAEIGDDAGNTIFQEVKPAAVAPVAMPVVTTPNTFTPAAPAAAATPPVTTPTPLAAAAAEARGGNVLPVRDPLRPLMVNSLSFELEYDVDRPAAAISKVEIWGTRDDGRTWVQLGLDDDRQSPCVVNVDREGMYGFSIVVDSGDGRSGAAPRAGTQPEIRVGVDLKAPQVRLTTAEPDPEGRAAALKINWQASDEHLGSQAVSLAYSQSPQGPWLPLAVGVANDGGRVCRFDPQGPDAVYLRIEVRDEAGNLGAFSTTAPIPVEKRQIQMHFAGATRDGEAAKAPKWFHVLR